MDGIRRGTRYLADPEARRVGWRRSLRTRLMVWSSLTSILLLAGVALIFYAAVRAVLIQNTQAEMRSLASQSARALAATLDSVQVSGLTLAGSAAGVGRQPMNLRALLMASLQADPDIAGAMLIIEPGRLSPDDPGFTWYIRREGTGTTESTVEELGYEDYRVMPWYIRTTTSDAPWWSEPYANEATAGAWFTTYNLPLRRLGEGQGMGAIGMVSVDVPVSRLRAVLGGAADDAALQSVLLSPEHRFVVHPDPQVALKRTLSELVREHGRSDLAPLADRVNRREPAELRHRVASGPAAGVFRLTFAEPIADTGWTYALSVDEPYILARLKTITLWGLGGGLVGVLLCVLVVRRYSGLIARPIEDLTDTARHFATGEFDYPLRHTEREDEVGVMARAFDSARSSIKRQIVEIAEMGAAQSRLESELGIASDIQQAMLPRGEEFQAGEAHLELHGQLEPAKTVGGDFYNFFERDGESLWFVIGDVSDKGVPAALFMARTMTVLEVAAQLGGSPGKALQEAARHLVEGNDTCMFATVLCGVIELRTGKLALASAGHEPPVLLRAGGEREFLPVPNEGPLGVDVAGDYPAWRGRLLPGDTLLTYTDGITEAFDRDNQAFGTDRLLAALDPSRDARHQCETLVAQVHAFAGDAPQSDDITVLAIRYKRDAQPVEDFSVKARLAPPLPDNAVRQLLGELDAGLSSHGLPATVVHDVHLVVEEVACNVLSHGAEEGRIPTLEVLAQVEGPRLSLRFVDDGRPFDPLAQPPPDLDADILDRPIGGLGLHLIRELAEDVAYVRDADRNVLRIVIPIPTQEKPA